MNMIDFIQKNVTAILVVIIAFILLVRGLIPLLKLVHNISIYIQSIELHSKEIDKLNQKIEEQRTLTKELLELIKKGET